MGFGQTQLPREAGVLDRAAGGGAGAAVVAGDEDNLGARLGDAGGDRPDTRLRDQLDADPGVLVGVFQVVDQLGQVLDRIDVVVGRRGNQRDAGGGTAGSRNPRVDLAARQVAALAGLCPLGHLDLDFPGVDEVLAVDAEPAGGHLFDGAAPVFAVGANRIAGLHLAAFAGVGLAAQPVHRDGHALVGLLGDGAVAHRAGLEAADDRIDALHLFQRDAAVFGKPHLKRAPEGADVLFVVDEAGELFKGVVIAGAGRLLEQVDGHRAVEVLLLARPVLVQADRIEDRLGVQPQRVEGLAVAGLDVGGDFGEADAAHPADGAGEILVDDLSADADRFEQLAALVGLDGADPHFGGDFDDAVDDRLGVVVDGGVVVLIQQAVLDHVLDRFEGQVGVDGRRAVPQKCREVVDLPRLRSFQHQRDRRPLFGPDQVFGDGRNRQQRGDRHMVFIHPAVGEDDDVIAVPVGPVDAVLDMVQGLGEAGAFVVEDRHRCHLEAGLLHITDLEHVKVGEDGVVDPQDVAV